MGRISDAEVRTGRGHVDRVVSAHRYARQMAWTAEDRERRFPEVQRGWELIGAAVKRRRFAIRWSQRDLERASGIDQTRDLAPREWSALWAALLPLRRLVAAMNGLDPDAPHPPLRALASPELSRLGHDAGHVHQSDGDGGASPCSLA